MKKLGFPALSFLSIVSLFAACSHSNDRVTGGSGGANPNALASGTPPPYNASQQNPIHQAPYGAQRNNTGGR